MDRGTYVAASGGLHSSRRLDVVADNLANSSTVGFKAQRLVSRQQEFSDTLASRLENASAKAVGDQERTPGVVDLQTMTDFSPGPISYTGDPLNVALPDANTFFAVNTPEGLAYTRAGNFTRNVDGNLVTADGMPVIGDGGPITLPIGSASISSTGAVIVDGETIASLQVTKIDDPSQLERVGNTRFVLKSGGGTNVPANVVPGSVEMPNVSVVEAMVDMIAANRGFEAYSKTVKSIDELNEVALRAARGA